ncbi:MAG: hypothetical protein KF795_15515 [Labilithrix sp.]|nr:hypothetical protein [Labilithrix sp.]
MRERLATGGPLTKEAKAANEALTAKLEAVLRVGSIRLRVEALEELGRAVMAEQARVRTEQHAWADKIARKHWPDVLAVVDDPVKLATELELFAGALADVSDPRFEHFVPSPKDVQLVRRERARAKHMWGLGLMSVRTGALSKNDACEVATSELIAEAENRIKQALRRHR